MVKEVQTEASPTLNILMMETSHIMASLQSDVIKASSPYEAQREYGKPIVYMAFFPVFSLRFIRATSLEKRNVNVKTCPLYSLQ